MSHDPPRTGHDELDWPQLLADATLEGVLIHEGGRILRVNAALARMLGYEPAALVGMHGTDVTAPDDRDRLRRHLAAPDEAALVGHALRADGSTFPCELRGRTVRQGDRELRVVLVRDVSRRVAMESELRRRERELASLADNSLDVITRYDREHRVRFMSGAVQRATGMPPEAFLGRRMRELGLPLELVERWERTSERVLATGIAEETDFEFTGPDGVARVYHTTVVPERGDSGEFETVLTTTRDLTALKRAERAAREAYATLRGLIDQSLTGVYVIQDGRFRYVNRRLADIFGYEGPDEILALDSVGVLVHPEDRATVDENLRRRISGEQRSAHYAFRGVRRDGAVVAVEVHGSAAPYEGRPAVVGTLLDVTEQRQLEARLREAHKMEALGQLAGGVAHDFNNILTAIAGYAQVLQRDFATDDPRGEDVGEILRAAERGAGVTRQLLAFSRRHALETEVLDLAVVVRELGPMLAQLLPRHLDLRLPSPEASAHVRATRAQLEQIVLNLALNARDAMPGGGTVTLDVRTALDHAGPRALLEVRDTGIGMPPDVRARAFEPFFTTKRKEQGTGLGLATVYGLVRQFGGEIELDSAEGLGTVVTIGLPLATAVPAAPVAAVAEPPTSGRRRILLAEDEAAIRALVRRVLERAGYDVLEAPHGGAALAVLQAGTPVDLLLTDAAMPELSGVELAREASGLRPDLPVVLMSGYAELSGASVHAGGAVAGTAAPMAFIEKPFAMDRLLAVVARTLGAAAASAR